MHYFSVCKNRVIGIPMPVAIMLNNKYRQAVKAMKITAFILLVGTLHVSAGGFSQTISLSEKDVPLSKIFKAIEKQTKYVFFYNTEYIKTTDKVSLEVKNMLLQEVLDLLFKNRPVTYKINGKMITILPKKNDSFLNNEIFASPPHDIQGKVVDETGKPLAGVTVTVKGTKRQTITNENGEFSFTGVESNALLTFSSVNMEPFSIGVGGQKEIVAKLKTKTSELDEVQIIAYGTTTRRLSTGNVASVKASDIEKQPVNNPLLALQGRVPGLIITQSSGFAGSGVRVQVQGQTSIGGMGTDPLYIVDGVPYPSRSLYTLNPIQGSSGGSPDVAGLPVGSGSPFSFINPADIESIDILKDADATAIYGSRAGNGAILITTKKGKAGKTKVSFNLQTGTGNVGHFLDVLNREQYLEMRHEAFTNDGAAPVSTDYDLNGTWDTTRSTDWQKLLIGGTAHYTDLQTNVSGGTVNTQFLVGAGYHKETTVLPGNLADQRGSLHFNINNVTPNQKFHLQLTGSYLVDNNKLMQTDLTGVAVSLSPVAPTLYNDDGSLNWAPLNNGNSTWVNPLAYLYNEYANKTNNFISNLVISYEILRGFNIKSSFGYNSLQSEQYRIFPLQAIRPERRAATVRNSDFSNSYGNSWIIEPGIEHKFSIAKLKVNSLIGATFLNNSNNIKIQGGSGYSSDLFIKDIGSAPTKTASSRFSQYKYNAFFGRISANWDDKYIINLTARRDGSSRFGAENLFHNFGSVAGAWVFSKESFIADEPNFISFGKLRASYGTTGNDQIGDYRFLNLYNTISAGVAYQNASGITPNGLPNPYLQWEETKKLQFGLDLGFVADRILLTANYYRNRCSNQLLNYTLPITTGSSSITRNFPATIQNYGWEFSLNTSNFKSEHFSWSSSFNLTIPSNKLLSFPGIETSSYATTYAVGQPVTIARLFDFGGVDPATGRYIFIAANGSITSSPSFATDFIIVKKTAPKFYGGFQNTLSYKGFQLDVLFQFAKQVGPNSYALKGNEPGQFFSDGTGNQPINVLNRWQKPGDETSNQRFYAVFSSNILTPALRANSSDGIYTDASYIRMKNASLSWQTPEKWIKLIRLQDAKIYVQAQNLLTITKYSGLDPEILSSQSLPPLRVVTIGIQVSF
jgi:TonB-linked SusC/RagA family outer membrane protein